MQTGHNCEETFPDGITNGAHWYELSGMLISISMFSIYSIEHLFQYSFILLEIRWNARF